MAEPHECSFLSLKLSKRRATGSVQVLIADKTIQRVYDQLKALTPRNWGQSLEDSIRGVNVYLRGWLGYFAVCATTAVLKAIDGHLRRRLRAIILKQWKRKWMMIR